MPQAVIRHRRKEEPGKKGPESQDEADAGQEAQVNRVEGLKGRSEDHDAKGKRAQARS
jgi:hypothetical protein